MYMHLCVCICAGRKGGRREGGRREEENPGGSGKWDINRERQNSSIDVLVCVNVTLQRLLLQLTLKVHSTCELS